jgi:ubiquinone/menaquinone biosynthesis C-methylase UbiE
MTLQKDPEGIERKILHKFVDFAGKRVLEIGCGEGRLTWKYAASTKQVIGIDPDRDSLRVATIDRPSDLQKQVLFNQASSLYLPFSEETFDSAIFAWSL